MFLWGIDVGLGFTTIRVGSLYWMVALVTVVVASPWMGAAILCAYGIALVLNLGIGTLFLERGQGVHGNAVAIGLFDRLKAVLAVALLAWSVSLMAIAILR